MQDGTFDLGIVPARSWDDLGVTSLRALQAPFLLDSDELVDEVVRGDLVEPLLEGLEGTGVRGLALWPESLRHPVGFGTPLLSLAEFHGAGIRAPYSRDVFAMIRALGSQPLDLNAKAMNAGYAAGRVAGAESGADVRLRAAGDHHGRRDALREDRHTRHRRRRLGPLGRPGANGAHRRRPEDPRLVGDRPSARGGAARPGLRERVGGHPGRGGGGRRDRAGHLPRPRGSEGGPRDRGRPSRRSRR